MPHLTFEYTANIPFEFNSAPFFAGLHELLASFDTLVLEKIKSRVVCHPEYYIGAGDPKAAFLYLQIGMFEGRPEELRKEISRRSLEYIKGHFGSAIEGLKCSVTVEVREICRSTFSSASGI